MLVAYVDDAATLGERIRLLLAGRPWCGSWRSRGPGRHRAPVPLALSGALEQALQLVVQDPVGCLELVDLVRERAAPVRVEAAQDVLAVVDAIWVAAVFG
ncbi:hypothetical protein PG989_000271 [Apiospora arundinis]